MGPAELLREAQNLHFAKQFDQAFAAYERLISRFPDSKQATVARQQVQNLRPSAKREREPSVTRAPPQPEVKVPPPIVFSCPACRGKVRVSLPWKSPTFRCGACKQELSAEVPSQDPHVIVVTAKIVISNRISLDEYRPAFEVLGIEPTADMTEIRKAWRAQLSQYHPDRVASLGRDLRVLAEEKTKLINAAFDALEEVLGGTAA